MFLRSEQLNTSNDNPTELRAVGVLIEPQRLRALLVSSADSTCQSTRLITFLFFKHK